MSLSLIIYSLLAGITVFIGGLLANSFEHHKLEKPVKYGITHFMMSFGAGIILAALSLVLVPRGMEELEILPYILTFLAGSITFLFLDKYLKQKGGQVSMLLAMLMDFIPESIVLGAMFASESSSTKLLAVIIGLQNLPEAFNSFRDLVLSGFSVKKTFIIFGIISLFGIPSAYIGHAFLSDHPDLTAYLMTFASGGILYLLTQDIIPESKLKNSHYSALGACLGFLVGIIGEKII
ncbi:ZIP family metal transporter [Marinigracilibium pacificum]|uniref:Divalent cation transporter n=1 Tax=Marinigracilibium pacificum TaxID=2729599 RepID=A0A848J081_9BACT|nr:divalent cation transporter [Marinigracilibium pacificum]NMM47669.1 divalent cation transporter [Marinigracilibium pacificum]